MVAERVTVVQIVPELDEGGVEGETVDVAMYLAKQGHRSIVVSAGGRLVPFLEKNGCIHYLYPGIGAKNPRCIPSFFRLRKFLQNEHIDILHLRSRLPAWVGWLVWKSLPKTQRPRLITTFHGFHSVNCYSRIMTRGERVVAVSEAVRKHIIENYGTDNSTIETIYGGFDAKTFNPQTVDPERVETLRQRWLVKKENMPVILLPGRLTNWKGQKVLIEALANLKRKCICLFIGDVNEQSNYVQEIRKKIAECDLQESLILTGHCDDMPAALLLADIVVSASSAKPEAFGKIAVEAMAMGKPVIATAHGGSLETVVDGETGWLFPPDDVESLTEVLNRALSSPELYKQYGTAGRKHVLNTFTAEIMCRKTLELYLRMLDKEGDES